MDFSSFLNELARQRLDKLERQKMASKFVVHAYVSCFKHYNFRSALNFSKAAAWYDKSNGKAHIMKGISLYGLRRYEEALNAFLDAMRTSTNICHRDIAAAHFLESLWRHAEESPDRTEFRSMFNLLGNTAIGGRSLPRFEQLIRKFYVKLSESIVLKQYLKDEAQRDEEEEFLELWELPRRPPRAAREAELSMEPVKRNPVQDKAQELFFPEQSFEL